MAIVSPRTPADRLPAWLTRMRPPVWPIAAAAAGVYLVQAAYTLSFPVNLTGYDSVIAALGAALLGAATAATATRSLAIRIAISLILVPGYALIVTPTTIGYLTAAYTATLIWWHLTATARTLRDALPNHPLTRWFAKDLTPPKRPRFAPAGPILFVDGLLKRDAQALAVPGVARSGAQGGLAREHGAGKRTHSEVPASGFGSAALDCRVAPRCPPGPVLSCLASAAICR